VPFSLIQGIYHDSRDARAAVVGLARAWRVGYLVVTRIHLHASCGFWKNMSDNVGNMPNGT